MKIYKEGDKSKAICESCRKMTATTFKVRDVPLSSGRAVVKEVLAAVCDDCDHIVALPQQSASQVRETINSVKRPKKPIEVRVPHHLNDIWRLACEKIGGPSYSPDLPFLLVRFYTRFLLSHSGPRRKLSEFADSEFAKGKASSRISLKASGHFLEDFTKLLEETHLSNTDLIKGIFVQMNNDLIQKESKTKMRQLKEMAAISA